MVSSKVVWSRSADSRSSEIVVRHCLPSWSPVRDHCARVNFELNRLPLRCPSRPGVPIQPLEASGTTAGIRLLSVRPSAANCPQPNERKKLPSASLSASECVGMRAPQCRTRGSPSPTATTKDA